MLWLDDTFAGLWADGDPFEQAMALTGEPFRELADRRTVRFEIGDRSYFAKIHEGVGWREIFKNLLQLKFATVSARSEWRAIQRLGDLGIATMRLAAYGERGWNPAAIRSFVVTDALKGVESLEDLFTAPARWQLTPRQRIALVDRVAGITRDLHSGGVNHRDYYLCHLLLDRSTLDGEPAIHVIDLHRAQIRDRTPLRWRVKDVSALFYSAIGDGLRRGDLFRFMVRYSGRSLRETLDRDAGFWRRVYRRGVKMYLDDGKPMPRWLAAMERRDVTAARRIKSRTNRSRPRASGSAARSG